MNLNTSLNGLFVAEGSSDSPLASIVETLFFDRGVQLHLSSPDFSLLKVSRDVRSKVIAGLNLMGEQVDLIVVHRDADSVGDSARRAEVEQAVRGIEVTHGLVPVIPVRMTEAWLLLDELAIRRVAGNPTGRTPLNLPKLPSIESVADPKTVLRECLLTAAEVTGRRRDAFIKRFSQHRRQLLERLDVSGPVVKLASWQRLAADVESIADSLIQS